MNYSQMNYSSGSESVSNSQSRGTSVINLSQFSSQTDRENFNILRLRAELVHLISSEITLELENYRKEMFLKYLIAATCPLDILANETIERRNADLQIMIQNFKNDWVKILQDSLNKLDNVKHMCRDITSQRDDFLEKFRMKKTSVAELQRVDEYIKIFTSILNISKINYEKVTSEYLVLRHNGKTAQEILNRKRLIALEKQKQCKRDLEQCERDITSQLESSDAFYKSELKTLTQNTREDVVELEMQIDELEAKIGINAAQFKERKQSLTKELKKLNKNYKILQQKRKFELQAVRSELSNLRETITNMDSKVSLDKHALYSVPIPFDKNGGLSEKLRQEKLRMSEFQNQLKYIQDILNQGGVHEGLKVANQGQSLFERRIAL